MSWHTTRMGKVTSSQVSKILGTPRTKGAEWTGTAETYLEEVLAEITTGQRKDEVSSKAIEWGNEYESEAFAKFAQTVQGELKYFGKDDPQFFALFEFEGFAGGSPDFTWNNVVGEIKCPFNSAIHVKRVLKYSSAEDLKSEEPEIYAQIQMNMMCTGCESGVFVSYDPRQLMKPLFTLEVPADSEYQQLIRTKIAAAKNYVQQSMQKFQ
jgi:hypothetical protein